MNRSPAAYRFGSACRQVPTRIEARRDQRHCGTTRWLLLTRQPSARGANVVVGEHKRRREELRREVLHEPDTDVPVAVTIICAEVESRRRDFCIRVADQPQPAV